MLFVSNTNAQTKLWGVGAPNGQAAAEFQTNFVQSTTAANYSVTEWTALSISDSSNSTGSGANIPGAAYWQRSTTGLSQGAYAISEPAKSNSVANGVAIFDSDFLDNGGVAGAFGTGSSPAYQKAELISPRMDLTGATDSAIIVEFYSYYRHFNVTEYSVSVSVDDGVSWSSAFDIKSLQFAPRNNPVDGTLRVLFPNVTTGVSNLTQCRVKFTFNGRYYFTMLDDILVETAPEYDIAIGLPREVVSGSHYEEIGDIVRLSNNTHRPLINVDPTNLADWIWGAKVVNYGTKTIQAANAPSIKCSIDFTDASGVTTYGVYLDTLVGGPTDSISANDPLVGVTMIDHLRELDFIISHGAGTYNVTYWVEHNLTDGSPVNDTVKHDFVITDNQGGTTSYYLTKSKVSPLNNRVYGEDRFTIDQLASFEYGSIYSFPRGASDSIKIDSVDFVYYLAGNFTGPANQTVFVNIYEYVDGSNGGTSNGSIEGAELTKIAFAAVPLTGLGTTVPTRSYTLATATNFVNATGTGSVPSLKDNAYYYITLELNPSQTGGSPLLGTSNSPFLAETRLNYALNRAGTSSAGPVSATTAKVVNSSGSIGFYDSLSDNHKVPSIGIHLSASPLNLTKITKVAANAKLEVYPSPTTDYLTIDVQFNAPTDVQYVITDVSGRVVYLNQSNSVSKEEHKVDVSMLPSGVYFIAAKTTQGVSTKRIVKK